MLASGLWPEPQNASEVLEKSHSVLYKSYSKFFWLKLHYYESENDKTKINTFVLNPYSYKLYN